MFYHPYYHPLIIIILILLIIGLLPRWPYMASRGYSYYPSSGIGILLIIIILLLLLG